MRDYTGDMSYFQNQLEAKGITVEQFDMTNYCGLTQRELQNIVNAVIKAYEKKEKKDV